MNIPKDELEKFASRARQYWGRSILSMLGLLVLILVAMFVLAKPRLDREWVEHLARMPDVTLTDTSVDLDEVRNWSYNSSEPVSKDTTGFSADFADLQNVWLMLEPHPGIEAMAHTLVLFEFPNDELIGLTIEARKEQGEKYDAFWGTFNKFELAYIWATPKDLLTRRAVLLDHEVLVYPLDLTGEQERSFMKNLLEKTIRVSTKARFYNTLFSNCTNELAKTADLAWDPAFILTGYSAQALMKRGLIAGDDFDTVRQTATLTQQIKDWNTLSASEFNSALLAALRGVE